MFHRHSLWIVQGHLDTPAHREQVHLAMRTGIYFDLPEEDYHADLALGSHDLRLLLQGAPDYWWNSPLNPEHTDSNQTPQQRFGSALHKYVLEGTQAFAARFVRRPDDLPRLDAKAKASIAPNGEDVLDGEDYDRIKISAELIAQNPELGAALEGGFPEVSVFWQEHLDGFSVPCKARFDYLKPRGIGDLKSIRNYYGQPFAQACRRAITTYRYDIQAAHYLHGRAQLPRFVADNLVYGDCDRAWLARVAASPSFAFQFIFFQAEGATNIWSCSLSPGNPILDIGNRDRSKALAVYREFMQTLGPDEMWKLQEPVEELDINQLPTWFR